MIKVYIASPYTKGDVAVNVRVQMEMAHKLMDLGFAPFVPLYSHFQHMFHPRPYEDWIKFDNEWVLVCDCVLRLPGESSGADGEVKLADENGIPVFYSVEELIVWSKAKENLEKLESKKKRLEEIKKIVDISNIKLELFKEIFLGEIKKGEKISYEWALKNILGFSQEEIELIKKSEK